jgi:thiol-disulfide isomerase/thioredoxin
MLRRCLLLAALVVWGALGGSVVAAPMEDFTATTWSRWQSELPRPAIVVFSTTYCPTCPDVLASLAAAVKETGGRVPLVAVVMDADGRREVAHLKHFGVADRLFAFRGQEAALRYSVDPRWRGVTPYVALFGAQGAPTFSAGSPSAQQMRALLARP